MSEIIKGRVKGKIVEVRDLLIEKLKKQDQRKLKETKKGKKQENK